MIRSRHSWTSRGSASFHFAAFLFYLFLPGLLRQDTRFSAYNSVPMPLPATGQLTLYRRSAAVPRRFPGGRSSAAKSRASGVISGQKVDRAKPVFLILPVRLEIVFALGPQGR